MLKKVKDYRGRDTPFYEGVGYKIKIKSLDRMVDVNHDFQWVGGLEVRMVGPCNYDYTSPLHRTFSFKPAGAGYQRPSSTPEKDNHYIIYTSGSQRRLHVDFAFRDAPSQLMKACAHYDDPYVAAREFCLVPSNGGYKIKNYYGWVVTLSGESCLAKKESSASNAESVFSIERYPDPLELASIKDLIATKKELAQAKSQYNSAISTRDSYSRQLSTVNDSIRSEITRIDAANLDLSRKQAEVTSFNLVEKLSCYGANQISHMLIKIFAGNLLDDKSIKIKQAILAGNNDLTYDPNYEDGTGRSLLKLVLEDRCVNQITLVELLDAGLNMARLFAADGETRSALKILLDGASAEQLNALHLAERKGIKAALKDLVMKNDDEGIKKLLSADEGLSSFDIAPDLSERTFQLLHFAVVKGKVESIKAIIDTCPDARYGDSDYGKPILLVFKRVNISNGPSEISSNIIQLFKESGVDYGQELLQVIEAGDGVMMTKMIVAMPELLEASYGGRTLEDVVSGSGHASIVEAFASFVEESYWRNMRNEFEQGMESLGSDDDSVDLGGLYDV